MGLKILTIDSEYRSCSKLSIPFLNYYDRAESFVKDVCIRWGNASTTIYNKEGKASEFPHVINSQKAISLNCDKYKALRKLGTVVKIPRIFANKVPKRRTAVIRTYHHSRGEGFSIKKGVYKIPRGSYATEFLRTKTEFRVFFCNDKTICAKRISSKNKDKYPCRSMWGYKFQNISKKLHEQTLLAAKAMGLSFGGADVLFYKNNYYFCELNTAVTLDNKQVTEFYQTNLKELAKKMYPELKVD